MTEESSILPPRKTEQLDFDVQCFVPRNSECFEQSTRPSNSDPRNLSARIKRGFTMKIKKGTNRMVLLKFLLAKMIYSKEGISLEEYLVIYHIFYEILDSTDPLFIKKYDGFIKKLTQLLKIMANLKEFPVIPSEGTVFMIQRILTEHLPSPREYFGLAGQRDLRNSFRLVLSDTIVPRKDPPKRFIGVGYKDKGTCRDPAYDGTLPWTHYASYFCNLEREAEELDSSSPILPEEWENEV